MRADSRRILLISYHFPPSAAVGGQRIANFARYLSRCGWHPNVLTIRVEDVERLDPGRLGSVDGVEVSKARVLPTAIALASDVSKLIQKRRGPGLLAAGKTSMVRFNQPPRARQRDAP
jgi:hypothetical protein